MTPACATRWEFGVPDIRRLAGCDRHGVAGCEICADVPLDLDAITARAEAATPGEWGYEAFPHRVDIDGPGGWANFWRGAERPEFLTDMEPAEFKQARADAEFIAHARTDIPALLAEVSRLRTQVRELEDALEDGQRLRDQLAESDLGRRQMEEQDERNLAEIIQLGDQRQALIDGRHECTEIGNMFGGYNCTCGEPWLDAMGGCQVAKRQRTAEGVVARITAELSYIESDPPQTEFERGAQAAATLLRAVLAAPTNTPAPTEEEQP